MSAEVPKKVITYVGRTTNFYGKTMWEIIGSLRNQGVGRLIERALFRRYPEPSYMRIVRVETYPEEERRRVRVWVQKTFRGRTLPNLTEMFRTTYKPDYRLIPRNEEHKYLNNPLVHTKPDTALANTVEMPPLMKESIVAECKRKGLPVPSEFVMPLSYHSSPNRIQQIARTEQVPPITVGIGKPHSPSLYKGLPL